MDDNADKSDEDSISVEVVYAIPEKQILKELRLPAGSTVMDALEASGLLPEFERTHPKPWKFGIFSEPCEGDRILEEHDRVEVYRPLLFDPKDRRRLMAAKSAAAKKKANAGGEPKGGADAAPKTDGPKKRDEPDDPAASRQ